MSWFLRQAMGGVAALASVVSQPTPQPDVVWWTSSASNIQAKDGAAGDNWKIRPANVTQAGNGLYLGLTYPHGLTPTISDNNGNVWPGSAAVVSDGGVGELMTTVWFLPNANAGTTTVNVAFGSNITPFFYEYGEVTNVATVSAVNGTHAAANQSGSTISAGLFTPGNNDVGGGNLIIALFCEAANAGEPCGTAWAAGGSFKLLSADIAGGTGQNGYPHAAMYWLQTAQAAVTPTITPTGATTNKFNCCAIALKAATAGANLASGSMWVRRILHGSQPNPLTSGLKVQIPTSTTGNLWAIEINLGDTVTQVTDSSDGFTTPWTKRGSGSGFCGIFYRANVSPTANLQISIDGLPGSGFSYSGRFYDIEGAATASVEAQTFITASGSCSGVTHLTDAPSFTPVAGAVGGMAILGLSLGQGPSLGFDTGAPAGIFFDLVNYDTQTDLSTVDNSDGSAHLPITSTATVHANYIITPIGNNSYDAVVVVFKKGP